MEMNDILISERVNPLGMCKVNKKNRITATYTTPLTPMPQKFVKISRFMPLQNEL